MRIGLLTHQWPGVRLGGIGVYTINAARSLTEAGHEVHVFTLELPADAKKDLPVGVTLHEVQDLAKRVHEGKLPGVLASAIQAGGTGMYRLAIGAMLCDEVRKVHREVGLDVVEGPEYEGLGLPLMTAREEGLALITHVHSGSGVLRRATGMAETKEQMLLEAVECGAILGADGLCAPSRAVIADTMKVCLVEGVEIVGLPFYADGGEFVEPKPDGAIVFLGRLEAIKGADIFAEALKIFLWENSEARVRIIGPDTMTGPDGESMKEWMKERIGDDSLKRVTFLGELPKGEIAWELAGAAFVVVPSLVESYSYVCCEAMAAGRPVIVSAGIGAADVVGDAGITFRRGDAEDLAKKMELLLKDAELQKKLAAVGYARVRGPLSAQATIGKRIDFYQRVIERVKSGERREMFKRMPAVYGGALVEAFARVTMFLTGVPAGDIETPGMKLLQVMEKAGAKDAVLYGAGRFTARLMVEKHLWEAKGHRVVGIIDDHERFRDRGEYLGLAVESREKFLARMKTDSGVVVVLSTDAFVEQLWEKTAGLRNAGIHVYRL